MDVLSDMPTVVNIKPLEEILEYTNPSVIYKFMEAYDVSFEDSSKIFEETKKWLWYCAKTKEMKSNGSIKHAATIDSNMFIVDEMWHTFILFTKDYLKFCKEYFGFFIHHSPTTKEEKEAFRKKMAEDIDGLRNDVKELYKEQYNLIYELLGEETLMEWNENLPSKFPVQKLNEIRKRL